MRVKSGFDSAGPVPMLSGMTEAQTTLPVPAPIDAAILQWDEALRALYLAELVDQQFSGSAAHHLRDRE